MKRERIENGEITEVKKKKKKWPVVVAILAVIIIIAAMGCGSSNDEEDTDFSEATLAVSEEATEEASEESTEESAEEVVASEEEESAEAGNTAESSAPETNAGTETETETETEAEAEVSFQELTVVDNDQCTIKITGIDPDNMWGYTLDVYLENKSADKNYMFSVTSAAVNGVMADPLFANEVAAGKKSNEEINFTDSDLSDNGIEEYTDIELSFRVHDYDDWTADDVAETTVHVYPYGEENATTFVREPQASDLVLFDNDQVTVVVTGYDPDSLWGYAVNLYLVNKTDKELTFSVDDASVNGYMADPFWATSVLAGKSEFTSMSWSDSTLEENGITSVEEIEMVFRAHDANDYSADDIINETVTLNP